MKLYEKLNVVTTGVKKRRSIIFLHGFPYDQLMWKKQVEFLQNDFHCVTYDIRGLGKSNPGDGQFTMEMFADDCLTIIAELELEKPVLCGLSMGGYLGFRVLERAQEIFSGAILCDTRAESDSDAAKLKRANAINQINMVGVEKFVEGFVPNCFSEKFKTENSEEYKTYLERSKKSNPAGVKGCLLAMQGRTSTTSFLEQIKIPTLLLCGIEDNLTPPSEMNTLAEKIPNSKYLIVPEAGHMTPIENPEFVNAAMKDFLNGLY
ncbi:MAG: alpha/beta fold hydrolase [Ignavibacteriaceae bacterium]|jgi:pimeloyl-ACP methyl ester carboxylesterase